MADTNTDVQEQTTTGFSYIGDAGDTDAAPAVQEESHPIDDGQESAPAADEKNGDAPAGNTSPTPAATAEEPAKQGPATPPAQPQPPVSSPAAPQSTPPAPVADPYEAIGISKDNTLGRKVVEALAAGEDPLTVLKVYATDWDKVNDLDLLRMQAEEKYKDLDAEDRAYMVKRDLVKYDTSSFDEDEARAVRIQQKLDAKAIRDGKKAEQSAYKIPDRAQPSAEELQLQKDEEAFNAMLFSHPYLNEFETNRNIKIGDGEDAFNYATPDLDLKASLQEPFDTHFMIRDANGKVTGFKLRERAEALAFVKNRDAFIKELAEHYMMLGEKRKDAELRNLGRPERSAPADKATGYTFIGNV